jgi:IclR family transcriptional regulator, acetate operon repressor
MQASPGGAVKRCERDVTGPAAELGPEPGRHMSERTESHGMRSVLTALRLLETVAERQPVGVSDLSRALAMPKSSVQRSVQTLHEAGWLRPTGGEPTRWQISYKALTVGLAGVAASGLQEIALQEMRPLRDATGETVHLAMPEGHELVVIGRLDGTQPLRTFLPIGIRAPLHAAASGRAMLAAMDDAEIEKILAVGIHQHTDRTKLEPAEIWEELARTRARGYAVNEGEWRAGIGAIGAVVRGRDHRPNAGISVSMPLARFDEIDVAAVGAHVVAIADRVGQLVQG